MNTLTLALERLGEGRLGDWRDRTAPAVLGVTENIEQRLAALGAAVAHFTERTGLLPASTSDPFALAVSPAHRAWLVTATCGMIAPAVREIAAETAAHLQDALETGHLEADVLGDPLAAQAGFSLVHLSGVEADSIFGYERGPLPYLYSAGPLLLLAGAFPLTLLIPVQGGPSGSFPSPLLLGVPHWHLLACALPLLLVYPL